MSDPNKYINYYVENALGMVHEYVNLVLQAKTQARVTQEQLQEKDLVIAQLTEQVEKNKLDSNQLSQAAQNARSWEDQYNTMKNKVAHMDTLTSQFNDLKNQFVDRNNQIAALKQENDMLRVELDELKEVKAQLAEKEAKLNKLTKSAERKATKVSTSIKEDNSPKKVINNQTTEMLDVESEKKIDDF